VETVGRGNEYGGKIKIINVEKGKARGKIFWDKNWF